MEARRYLVLKKRSTGMVQFIIFSVFCMFTVHLITPCCRAEETSEQSGYDSAADSIPAPEMPQIFQADYWPRISVSQQPETEYDCYLYPDYIVVAWSYPKLAGPVVIVRKRNPANDMESPDCSPDSLPGDFVIRYEEGEYFSGMWGDLLLIDYGTSNVRALILYDIPSRSEVLTLEGFEGMEGWIDSVMVCVWLLSAYDMPRYLCPDIHEDFMVGIDSLFTLNLETFSLTALGPWRCNQLQ